MPNVAVWFCFFVSCFGENTKQKDNCKNCAYSIHINGFIGFSFLIFDIVVQHRGCVVGDWFAEKWFEATFWWRNHVPSDFSNCRWYHFCNCHKTLTLFFWSTHKIGCTSKNDEVLEKCCQSQYEVQTKRVLTKCDCLSTLCLDSY